MRLVCHRGEFSIENRQNSHLRPDIVVCQHSWDDVRDVAVVPSLRHPRGIAFRARARSVLSRTANEPFFYWRIEPVTRSQTSDLLNYLELEVAGRRVADLGPGNGASSSALRARGAETYFVEKNPVLYAYRRLRGFHGRLGDFLTEPLLPETDVLYVRGSITGSNFRSRSTLVSWLDSRPARTTSLALVRRSSPRPGSPPRRTIRYERAAVLGVQTPLYPYTWVTRR